MWKINVKLSDSQLNKLKPAVKNQTRVILRTSIKIFEGNNIPHELLLTTRKKTTLTKTFKNNMSTDIKFSKTQISKMIQSEGFLGFLLGKKAVPLTKIAVRVAKNILVSLGITATACCYKN